MQRSGKPPDQKQLELSISQQNLEREQAKLRVMKETLADRPRADRHRHRASSRPSSTMPRTTREQALVRSPLDGVVVQIYSRQGERVSPSGIAKIVDLSQLRVLADVDELHVGRIATGGKVEVTFRGSPTVYKGTISRVAPTVKRMQRIEPDGGSSTDAPRGPGRDRARRSVQHAAGARPRDPRHLSSDGSHAARQSVAAAAALAGGRTSRWRACAPPRRRRRRMPLGAQQLKRQRTSTLLSLAGVTASLLVIFAQLGIERAVYDSAIRLHRSVAGDLVLVPLRLQVAAASRRGAGRR